MHKQEYFVLAEQVFIHSVASFKSSFVQSTM